MYPLRVVERQQCTKKIVPLIRVPWVNMCWLASEDIVRRVGALETDGWISGLQARLDQDSFLMRVYERNHIEFARMRWSLLTPADQEFARTAGSFMYFWFVC